MADTTTPLLGLLLMGTGGDNNAWGSNLNTQVITLAENAIAGVTTLSISGGSHTLSATEARSATIELTGTLSSSQVLIVPSTAKKWTFINQCVLGGFEVQVQTSGNPLRNLPGGWTEIVSDGTGALARQDGHLVGELFYTAATTAPGHSLECNGATASRTLYGDLFAKIGTTWGPGDGFTTFTLPNGEDTNRFLRAAGGSLTVGTYQANQFASHTHTGSGTTSGQSADHAHAFSGTTGSMNANASHTHTSNAAANVGGSNTGGGGFPLNAQAAATINATNIDHAHTFSGETAGTSNDHTHTFSFTTAAAGSGAETRPEAMVALLCIRY